MSITLYAHVIFIVELGFEGNHLQLTELLTKHADSNVQFSGGHNVVLRDWIQRVSESGEFQKSSDKPFLCEV